MDLGITGTYREQIGGEDNVIGGIFLCEKALSMYLKPLTICSPDKNRTCI